MSDPSATNPYATDWVWSDEAQCYWRNEYINDQWQVVYHSSSSATASTAQPSSMSTPSYTSYSYGRTPGAGAQPGTVPTQTTTGTETLDPSYQLRTDARSFYIRGRMFATLHIEAYGGTATGADAENVFTVKYGEKAYCQIRRFVVVKDDRGYCLACPVATYRGRGTTKRGVNPKQHAVIFTTNSGPNWMQGETEMDKDPIGVDAADPSIRLGPASRINFGQVHCIQHNVKVKDLGVVRLEDLPKLVAYWRAEMQN
ncbi:hypothetical protein EJ05DRAFT_475176 [Pseudovirgaria hyperparasitica]|uniref:DUF6590 domain-containing protein n=1 Tax=Pseudovirgaria hyperparasitica TaxID=470096 RepID=A0A6A6WAS7_9PEZI|nr:uncharacterized protein EJ05DRAFT_475176 [Pseudovirgaria hyperparasitica]KAF2758936.1 hypothetical protein EJ05DRAFT_475176 [Pseudovirgaria hyperparasitica]